MSKKSKVTFDPKKFLTKVGDGKTIAKYQKDQIVFSQGDVAAVVFLATVVNLPDANGGLFKPNRMWSAVVDRQGVLCSVVRSDPDAWPGSRSICFQFGQAESRSRQPRSSAPVWWVSGGENSPDIRH